MLSSVIKGASLSLYEDIEINFDNNDYMSSIATSNMIILRIRGLVAT